jgi:fucose permease
MLDQRIESRTQQLAVVLAAASFAVFGGCLTLPGTLLPLLLRQFDMRLVEAGSMLALQPVAYLLSVLVAERLLKRFGTRPMLVGSLVTFAAGVAGFGLISSWTGGGAMLLVGGLGFGVMEVAVNTLLIDIGGARSSNLLNFAHLFFGVGSFVAPVLSSHAVAAGLSWRVPFLVAGVVAGGVGISWNLLPLSAVRPKEESPDGSTVRRLHSRSAVILAVMLALYVGVETGIGGWLTKYMVSERRVALSEAGVTLSMYWLGLAAGRLVLSMLAHRVREERLILVLTVASTAALVAALLVTEPWGAAACFAATGVGFSGIFPAVIALGGRLHPHRTAAVTSILIAGAGIGGIVIPWTMSAIADGAGLVAGMGFYVVMTGVMVVLAVLTMRAVNPDELRTNTTC